MCVKWLEILGKAQRESAWCPKSDWEVNSGGWNFPGSKVTRPAVKCISISRMRIVDLGWVNTRACNFFVSVPNFTKFFLLRFHRNRPRSSLFPSFDISIGFLRYSQLSQKLSEIKSNFQLFGFLTISGEQASPKFVHKWSCPPYGPSCGKVS